MDARGRGPGWGVTYFDQIKYKKDIETSLEITSSGGLLRLIQGVVRLLFTIVRRV